ncbi:hypothetical protein HDU92_005138 [Lobulomyces angularis]|nr:hypothetical protein HDU92_005138 [Lobulomyces angularis]
MSFTTDTELHHEGNLTIKNNSSNTDAINLSNENYISISINEKPPAKRTQVRNACTNCQKACKKCDEVRPCWRCKKYDLQDSCSDSIRKERQKGMKRGPYKKKNSEVVAVKRKVINDEEDNSVKSEEHNGAKIVKKRKAYKKKQKTVASPETVTSDSIKVEQQPVENENQLLILSELCSAVLSTNEDQTVNETSLIKEEENLENVAVKKEESQYFLPTPPRELSLNKQNDTTKIVEFNAHPEFYSNFSINVDEVDSFRYNETVLNKAVNADC